MKNIYKITFVITVLTISNILVFTESYNFSVGDTFDYTLKESKIDLIVGNLQGNFTGTRIGGANVPIGSQFSFKISRIFSGGFELETIAGEYNEKINYFDIDVSNRFITNAVFPVNVAIWFLISGQALVDYYNVGVQLFSQPFISVDEETWTSVKEDMGNIDTVYLTDFGTNSSVEEFNSIVTEKRKLNQIEVFLKGAYNDSSGSIFQFANSYKFAYSPTTGALLGNRFKGFIVGIIENTSIDISFEQHFEMTSFTLDPFELGDFATEQADGITAIIVVCSLPVIFFVNTVRRKKNYCHKSVDR